MLCAGLNQFICQDGLSECFGEGGNSEEFPAELAHKVETSIVSEDVVALEGWTEESVSEIGDEGVTLVEEGLVCGDILVGDVSRVLRRYLLELGHAEEIPVQGFHDF